LDGAGQSIWSRRTEGLRRVKLLQDTEAVVAAMVLSYSQGQTEGRINKLKLVKRSMYGRGKFDLLRQRVLYAAS
jgi:transposase